MEVIRKELETGTIIFVPVPDDGNPFNTGITARNPIPEGFWLLGISDQLTEDDLVGVMPKVIKRYQDFMDSKVVHTFSLPTALEAFNSLKESLQLGEGKHIVLFEAKK